MGKWDKISLRFIALVVFFMVLGYGIKFVYDVKQASDEMNTRSIQDQYKDVK